MIVTYTNFQFNSYNDIIALNKCIQKNVTYVTVIRGTLMSLNYTDSHLLSSIR